MSTDPSTLYIVSVPIGNLEDITVRASRILGEVDVIACEDTRNTSRLLSLLGIRSPKLISVHDHNEARRIPDILRRLEAGECIALVSDAGTPTVSDPGYNVIKAVLDGDFKVVPIPGVCAAITALSVSGLPTDRFQFVGFLPHKVGALRRAYERVAQASETLIFYVGPHHLVRALQIGAEVLGPQRRAVISRELTKKFEENRRGTLGELAEDPGTVRGEIVLVVEGCPPGPEVRIEDVPGLIDALILEGLSTAKAAKKLVKQTGIERGEAYKMIIAARESVMVDIDHSDFVDEGD
jgi:16S rRNA (cytidine1402-2'-O)-methyltransferase